MGGNAVTEAVGRVQNEVLLPFPSRSRQKITYGRIFRDSSCAIGKKAQLAVVPLPNYLVPFYSFNNNKSVKSKESVDFWWSSNVCSV